MGEYIIDDEHGVDDADEAVGFQIRQLIKREIIHNASEANVWKAVYLSAMYPLYPAKKIEIKQEDMGRISNKIIRFGGFCQAMIKFCQAHMSEIYEAAIAGKSQEFYEDILPHYYAVSIKSRVVNGILYLFGACSESGLDGENLQVITDLPI